MTIHPFPARPVAYDHGHTGDDCPLCTPARPLAVVLSLRAARQAAEPVRPCDSEPSGDVA
jgi:hypothetical protein